VKNRCKKEQKNRSAGNNPVFHTNILERGINRNKKAGKIPACKALEFQVILEN